MKTLLTIQKIHIYGFGKHENITILLQDGVTIFYGMNEAGKTTIQQFILQMLFGFPTKQQSQRKYEPKTSPKFGGQLTLLHPTYGQCTIERVKGKATGDVTVYMEDGTKGHDELLAKLLYGYSRASFEAIFSFSLHELQGIEKMSEDELTHLLLASGTTGIHQLSTLEKKLDKEAGELFKKSGKLPLINQKIEHLKQLEKTIKKEQATIHTFEDKSIKLQQLEHKLQHLYKRQKALQQEWQQLTIMKQALPLLQQQEALQQSLKSYTHIQFPTEGIRRYEQIKDRLTHETLQLKQLEEQCHTLQNKLQSTADEQAIEEMARLLHKEATWNQLLVKEQNYKDELFVIAQDIEAQFRLLGVQDKEAQAIVLEGTVSLQQEEQFQRQLTVISTAEEELKFYLQSLEQIHEELDSIARQKKRLEQESLTAEEEHILAQWPQRKRRLEQLRHVKSQRSKPKQPTLFIFLVLAISIVAVLYGVLEKNWAVFAIGAILSVLFLLFLKQAKQVDDGPQEHNHQLLKELEREEQIVQELLMKKQRLEDRLALAIEQQRDKEHQYAQLEHKIQQAEQLSAEANQLLQNFLKRFRLEGNIPRKLLPELFMRIRAVQELEVKRTSIVKLLQALQKDKDELYEILLQVLQKEYSEQEIFMQLRSFYLASQQAQQQLLQTKEQLALLVAKMQEVQSLVLNYELEIEQLLTSANVASENAFYEAFAQFQQQQKLQSELQTIEQQLASLDIPEHKSRLAIEQLHSNIQALEEERKALQAEIDCCLEERATLQIEKEQLLNDEKYGLLLQHFEQEKALLQQLLAQWATKKALATAIHETLFRLREEKLPHVMAQVNAIFHSLTGGRYDKLFIHEEGYFEAQSQSGLRYHVAELSQATKEQVYIALRMALAKTLATSAPFPFIMDDPFVHFDRNRTHKMVQLMKEVGYERQILYFTCHEGMLEFWQKEQIVDLGALANERGVTST